MTQTHWVLPGSLDIEGNLITGGVHVGSSGFDAVELRYVQTDISKQPPTATVLSALTEAYEGTEGCLVRGDYRLKD